MPVPIVINGSNPLYAWRAGCRHLVTTGGEAYNLLTHIDKPTCFCPEWLTTFNPRNVAADASDISDVVNTIFPRIYAEMPRDEVYHRYLCVHRRTAGCGHHTKKRWGTYFHRMIAFGARQGHGGINQLEAVINAIGTWKNTPKTAAKIVISAPEQDTIRPMGAPCLQYVQFLCSSRDVVNMLAVYRNHDFFGKVLGNFIGLGFLLNFVCKHTNRTPGTLTCHSAHADFYHYPKSKFIQLAQIAE